MNNIGSTGQGGRRTEDGGQVSEVRGQKTEGRGQGGHPSEIRFAFVKCAPLSQVNLTWQAVVNEFHRAGRSGKDRRQRAEVRGQWTEDRGRRAEVRGQRTEVWMNRMIGRVDD